MVDYRPIPDARDVFHEYRRYAFRPEEGVPSYDPDEHETPRDALGSRRGIFPSGAADDADPRSVCRHYWFASRVRGDSHPTAGLASVATPPEYRHRGHVRRLLAHSLAEYRDRGIRFSVLWPFQYRFYRRFGWDTANRVATHECAPSHLSFATEAVDGVGSFSRLEADDYERLERVYETHAERYGLALERDEAWWRLRIFGGGDRDPFVYAFERDGRVRGYLVYTVDGELGDSDRTMDVSELVAADHDAFLASLSFCHRHASQVERVRLAVPTDVPVRDVARDPDEVDTSVDDGPMVRIVDVAETLSALTYPEPPTDARLTIAVDDPLADWNDGSFELEVANGTGTCERLDDGTDRNEADVRIDVAALSQLAVGTRAASDLARTGRLDVQRSRSNPIETLESLFPPAAVYLSEFF